MSDYIKREDVKTILLERIMETAINNTNYVCDASYVYQDVADRFSKYWIDELPTADVVEPKHGKWLDVTTLDNEFICWVCSECRHGADFVYEPYNYCPNCGADMRGDSDV